MYFTVPDVKQDDMVCENSYADTTCERDGGKDGGNNGSYLHVPGTPTETFTTRRNIPRSPDTGRNNMKHSLSSASIDSGLKNDNYSMSETDSEPEWNDKQTHL